MSMIDGLCLSSTLPPTFMESTLAQLTAASSTAQSLPSLNRFPRQRNQQFGPKPQSSQLSSSLVDGSEQVNKSNQRNHAPPQPSVVMGSVDSATSALASVSLQPPSSVQVDQFSGGNNSRPIRPQALGAGAVAPAPAHASVVARQEAFFRINTTKNNRLKEVKSMVASSGDPNPLAFPQAPGSQSHIFQTTPFYALPAHGVGSSGIRYQLQNEKQPSVPLTPDEKAAKTAHKNEQKRLRKEKKKEEHFQLVIEAANATIAALREHGLSCAIFGSLACKLYGTFREPKDVDMLIIQQPDNPWIAQHVKALIVGTNPSHFYLKLPRDPTAPYRILYYRSGKRWGDCKVDILISGTMYLPDLFPPSSRNYITTISGIPLVPFSLLLVHKLQGWSDHITSTEKHKQRKHVQDAADVRRLLAMEEKIEEVRRTRPWNDAALFCEEFKELTKRRVKEYCEAFPNMAEAWELLGFDTVYTISSDLDLPS
ncbi:hypothetical protein D9756_006305 [Leucocoprinus leucothites]|uniref:Uncharacterized protein n=1 Tax=Leucocoprinus leucothites TaxID=201217 RepID=A0A8H5D349_9AGAR|nr:hypothetical protein D9756_006305 [Leucoagaricus leucothites]